MSLVWKRAVLDRDGACVVYHECEGDLQEEEDDGA